MWSDEGAVTYLFARVSALLPEDWFGRAGYLFRAGTEQISAYAKSRQELLRQGNELVSRKLVGLANEQFTVAEKNMADAAKSFAEREDKEIDTVLKGRALESDIAKRQADARKAKAEADLAEINVVQALYEFQKKLAADGVALSRDDAGNLQFLPAATASSDHDH